MPYAISPLTAGAFRAALPELLTIYAHAMGYDLATARARAPLWVDHSERPGFRCVIAVAHAPQPHAATRLDEAARRTHPDDPLPDICGFAYGYRGARGQWWWSEVARGLGSTDHPALSDYFELTELHVRPAWQGHGMGESLLRALVAACPQRSVLLSTPEGESRAWKLYRRLAFTDVLRRFLFTGDDRLFAVLGRPLPIEPARLDQAARSLPS